MRTFRTKHNAIIVAIGCVMIDAWYQVDASDMSLGFARLDSC